jgi:hypothetical protein
MKRVVVLTIYLLLAIIIIMFIPLNQRVLAQDQNQSLNGLGPALDTIPVAIQIIAGIATTVALIYAALTFRQSRKENQITMSTNFMKDMINLQTEIVTLISEARNTEIKRSVYQYLSIVEWFSFLVNNKEIEDDRIVSLFWPIVKVADRWYKTYFADLYERDINENNFSNLKKLFPRLQANESMQRIHFEPFEVLNPLKQPPP